MLEILWGLSWGDKKAPARKDHQEIGSENMLGSVVGDKKAPARKHHQEIGSENMLDIFYLPYISYMPSIFKTNSCFDQGFTPRTRGDWGFSKQQFV